MATRTVVYDRFEITQIVFFHDIDDPAKFKAHANYTVYAEAGDKYTGQELFDVAPGIVTSVLSRAELAIKAREGL